MTIISSEDLPVLREKYKDKKIVYCSGVFDLTHAGHALFFEDCKKQGDILIAALGSDNYIKRYKGKDRPILNEQVRLKMVDSLKPVDFCFLHKDIIDNDFLRPDLEIISILKPDVWAVNEDGFGLEQRKKALENSATKLIILSRYCPPEFEGISTTKIMEKLPKNKFGDTIKNCHVCQSSRMHKFLSLGHHPNPDGFLTEEQLKEPEIYYPLEVYFCEDCKLVQIGYAPDPSALFTGNFIYNTGSSKELIDNFHLLVEKIVKEFSLSPGDLVVDIGSNDGTLLENYLLYNIRVLGVDPAKAADLAIAKSIPTLKDFFNDATAQKILKEQGKARVITATNVFAHVIELDSFMNGIKSLLDDRGVFIQESGYIKTLIEGVQYDSVYVEHLRYYSLISLINLFDKFGMDIFDAEQITTHGGSIRTYACKKGVFPISDNVRKILKEEEESGLHSKELFDGFGKKVERNREKLKKILSDLKSQGKRIVGIGAPAKGNTLLNFCKIGAETLDFLLEKENLKLGMYSPGTHIKIVREDLLFGKYQSDYALLLSWNLKDIIIPKIRAKGFKGGIIIPVPEPYISY